MRDKWYADNRDLVKWSILIYLAKDYSAAQILQIAYYREDIVRSVEMNNHLRPIPEEVSAHFRSLRNIRNLGGNTPVYVFDKLFEDRASYLLGTLDFISSFSSARSIIFLDPDTGLEPANPGLEHVLDREVNTIWKSIKDGDCLAFYQHQTNRNGQPWIETKKIQFARSIGVNASDIMIASGPQIANDVVFFYIQKNHASHRTDLNL